MNTLTVVSGCRHCASARVWSAETFDAVHRAIRAGFAVGRRVRLGHVDGEIVGYNIAGYGPYAGAAYPLLVRTELGAVKCSMAELTPD